MFLEILTTSDV